MKNNHSIRQLWKSFIHTCVENIKRYAGVLCGPGPSSRIALGVLFRTVWMFVFSCRFEQVEWAVGWWMKMLPSCLQDRCTSNVKPRLVQYNTIMYCTDSSGPPDKSDECKPRGSLSFLVEELQVQVVGWEMGKMGDNRLMRLCY